MTKLLDVEHGVFDQCDAIGLHFYHETALQGLRLYDDLCEELNIGVEVKKPVWVTEFNRALYSEEDENGEDKVHTPSGIRAYWSHILEQFSSYGVERAFAYCIACSTVADSNSEFNYQLFDWIDEDSLVATDKWDYLVSAAEKHQDYEIGDSIGYGMSDGLDLFGISPFEAFTGSGYHYTNQSSFHVKDDPPGTYLESRLYNNVYAPISFDLNDTWVEEYPYNQLLMEVDILCDGGSLLLRYQSCCEYEFQPDTLSFDGYDELDCPAILDGLTSEEIVPDFDLGVVYSENTNVETIDVPPGTLTTVTLEISDFLFQNGMEKRADISFASPNNSRFEIHRIEIHPLIPPVYPVEYADKSSETQLEYSGQPMNAMSLDYDGDDLKDLFISRYDLRVSANRAEDYGLSGAPLLFENVGALPNDVPPGTTGLITADFDNDGWVDFFAPNPDLGAKLYRNIDGDHYADYTVTSGLNILMGINDDVQTCSWADYDGDGYVDLTVISGDDGMGSGTLNVFHNNAGHFDSTVIQREWAGYSPLWADFDNDGDLDLMVLQSYPQPVGLPENEHNIFLINQGDGTFVDDPWERIGITSSIAGFTMAAVADFDNDQDLDVVFSQCGGYISILKNNHPSNPGLGYFSLFDFGRVAENPNFPTDIAILDYDLDGFQDVLVGYSDSEQAQGLSSVHLFGNRPNEFIDRGLIDETTSSGISGSSKLNGLALADYNRDGFADIFLTRESTEPFFYKGQAPLGQNRNNWVGIRLKSLNGANNTNGLGATVKVSAWGNTYTQIVDGGSGFASQHEAELVFGLGKYFGDSSAQITWPNGHVQTLSNIRVFQYNTIEDDCPVIDNDSIDFQMVYHLDTGLVDWVFIWDTSSNSLQDQDKVTLDLSGVAERCRPSISELHEGVDNVSVLIEPLGDGQFQHTLTFEGLECEGMCLIPFIVESAIDDFSSTSTTQKIMIKACLVTP